MFHKQKQTETLPRRKEAAATMTVRKRGGVVGTKGERRRRALILAKT